MSAASSAATLAAEALLYPPSAFFFMVVFGTGMTVADTSFQEVSGIGSEVELEKVPEGGENRFTHQLPKTGTHGLLELKRGIAGYESGLVSWCRAVLEGDFSTPVSPMTISVYLMDGEMFPVRAWTFSNAYPVKWAVDPFGSTKNEVAIEKISLSYTYSNRIL